MLSLLSIKRALARPYSVFLPHRLLQRRLPRSADDASAPPVELPEVVVGATRLPTPETELGTSVTVISRGEIAAKQERMLPDALLGVPGLNMVQTGGPGGLALVFIRGTNSNQTKVFLDGIDVSDPSSPNGAFDFAHVLTFDLGGVEVLRGPQSGLYGSDAGLYAAQSCYNL